MTSEIETLKTNEFLRRRKLRLQQVREQSKDIAKKLRIRAQVEKLRHIVELDEKKENEYLERQEQIVEQLEQVYARGKQNTGASHNLAFVEKSNVLTSVPATSTGSGVTKSGIAKLRAREAAAQLRQKKQEDLDKKNKLLQRKLKAREAANEISREKCKPASHSKEPSAQATEEQALKRHSPCEVQCDSINAHVESKGVETQRVVFEDKPVSALALGPETYTSPPCSSLKPDITQSGGSADASLTKTSTNRKNIYNVFHSRNRQEGGRDPNEKKTLAAQTRNDMGTQWDNQFIPNEWVPNIPKLKLPDDDKVSTVFIDVNAQKPRQTKPSDLFAVSEDMPSNLRSKKVYSPPPLSIQSKSSLTLVSEYLHQRKLRLREHGAPGPSKRHEHAAELQNCKQTIIWARSTHNEGTINYNDLCSVHDEQVIPVPNWTPGNSAQESPKVSTAPRVDEPSSPKVNDSGSQEIKPRSSSPKVKPRDSSSKVTSPNASSIKCKAHGSGLTNSDINKIFKTIRPMPPKKSSDIITLPPKGVKPKPQQSKASSTTTNVYPRGIKQPSFYNISNESSNIIDLPLRPPSPVIRGVSPFRRNKLLPKMFHPANTANPELKTIPIEIEKPQAKTDRRKKSNVTVYNHFTKDERLIEGDDSNLVLRDDTPEEDAYSIAMRESEALKDKLHHEKAKANRSRIASDKQTVEKEYQDTMAFLNSLAKTNNCRPIKKAYMDEDRQQSFEERHQRKMQHAYRNIEKDAMRRQVSSKSPSKDTQGRRTKSPAKTIGGLPGDFQYSWMPVPESDASLFVHTIPTTTKDNVRFKNVDCYHEYRSRHKHTPPTRDKHFHNRARQEEPDSYVESEYYSSHDSRSSNNDYSIGEERQTKKSKKDSSDAERIIVYKILESKRKKDKNRKKTKFSGEHVRSVTSVRNALVKTRKVVKSRQGSLEHLNEGVYKNVAPKGQFCNLISSETTNIEFWQASLEARPWWENIQSLYFPASHDKNLSGDLSYVDVSKKSDQQQEKDIRQMQWDCGDKVPDERSTVPSSKQSQSSVGQMPPKISHLTFTKSSMSRGRTVSTEKETAPSNIETLTAGNMVRPDGGYVKLVGDKGQETEKFILGAAGLLNDDGYEVVIQLRKKDTGKKSEEQENKIKENPSQDLEGVEEVTSKLVRTVSSQSSLPYLEPALEDKTSTQSQPTRDVGPATPIQAKESDKFKENTEPMKQTVCTQTSLHSPSQRSLMIMSSSTSTAYMSPPEMILPACLKNNSETNTDKLGDSYLIKKQGKHVKCGCRKCTHVEPHVDAFDKKNMDNPCKSMSHVQVPPNTARSDVAVEVDEKPSRECTCPKCGYDKRIGSKNNKRKNRRYLSSDKHNAVHKKTTASSKLYKEELNPIIKDYVKRLLTLNKEGLKAIEVLNQECSSVTTPGSSIINIESNVEDKRSAHAKLSLEYVKNVLLQKIYEEAKQSASKTHRKKKPAHKIKSLNISKHLLRKKSDSGSTSKPSEDARLPSSTSAKDNDSDKAHLETMVWNRSQKQADEKNMLEGKHSDASMSSISGSGVVLKQKKAKTHKHKTPSKRSPSLPLQNTNPSDASSSTDYKAKSCGCSATKTSVPHQREHSVDNNINCEVNFMSIAETKVQNMERIANLTEKCTQRLSNLAKVLEEVRKNKSSTFSHLSTGESSSESEQKANKINVLKSFSQSHLPDNNLETKANLRRTAKSLPAKLFDNSVEGAKIPEISFDSTKSSNVEEKFESPKHYPSILEGIPKPGSQVSPILPKALSEINNNGDFLKRGKPPPALARMKHGPEDVIPHELSTVVEVDSPMSMKFKPQESVALENSEPVPQEPKDKALTESRADSLPNPDLLQSNVKLKRRSPKLDGSKMEMMDLNKFNEIMLKPFVSIEEFAKQCKVSELDEGSNIGNIPKDLMLNDDLSSMHSEGSLPDVIGELLKRNIITEPFKFDATSNIKSTTISSESSISVLALSKLNNKGKQKPYISIANREIAETSDTLSVSSNPDLENAFKKLGMGWASSTLKKTKERLALSSSSSSSSCSQKYMLKAFEKHESPTKKQQQNRNCVSVSTLKNAEQQTLQFKGVTVQEFLTNELANKITFNNKSHREETEQEFISLHETKMPEEMKYSNVQERSGSADNSGANVNRARTSTPVQLFKSLTYHSSSSSNNNISNGLFSNIDDLSSVKVTSSSLRNHSTSDKDDLTIPNFSLKLKRNTSDVSKSD